MKAWAKWLVAAVVVVVFVTAAGFVVLQVPEMLLLRSLVLNSITAGFVSLFTFLIGYKKIHEKHIRLGGTRAPWWVAYVVAGLAFWLAAYPLINVGRLLLHDLGVLDAFSSRFR